MQRNSVIQHHSLYCMYTATATIPRRHRITNTEITLHYITWALLRAASCTGLPNHYTCAKSANS